MRGWLIAIGFLAACGRIDFDSLTDPPRCDDAVQNDNETGIDCGGSCAALCPQQVCSADAECVTQRCETTCQLADLAWRAGPSLALPRYLHDCVTRSDDTVWVIGGEATGPVLHDSVEVLVPGATSFTAGPTLLSPRSGHTVGVASDDTIYVATGVNGTGPALTLERLGAASAGWTQSVAAAPDRRFTRGAVGADDRLYAFDIDSSSVYDIARDAWSVIASADRDEYAIATDNGAHDIYVIGGDPDAASGDNSTAAVAVWNTDAQVFSPRRPLPAARSLLAAVTAPDGRIYAAGGLVVAGNLALADAYTPAADAWLSLPPLGTTRAAPCAALAPDGRVFVIGGNTPTASTTTELYGPAISVQLGGTSGASVVVEGDGFAGGAAISVTINTMLVATGTTSASGDASLSFVVPPLGAGTYRVVVVDNRAQYPVHASLVVP